MIDLRSDTLTMPDRGMLETILEARLGDDGRTHALERGEDETVNRLEDMAAELTGKEAGVLFPSSCHLHSCKRCQLMRISIRAASQIPLVWHIRGARIKVPGSRSTRQVAGRPARLSAKMAYTTPW